jgi:hypothetical protein
MITGIGKPNGELANHAAGVDERQRPEDAERAERDDEGLQPAVRNQHAVDHATGDAHAQPDGHPGPGRHPGGQQAGRDHGRQRGHRTDRQIDAARDDDQGHAHRNAGIDAALLQDVDEVARAEEGWGERRKDREDQHQADQGAHVAPRQPEKFGAPHGGVLDSV